MATIDPQHQMPQQPQPKKKGGCLKTAGIGLAVLLGLGMCSALVNQGNTDKSSSESSSLAARPSMSETASETSAPEAATSTPSQPEQTSAQPSKASGPATSFEGDGTYEVGVDIAPGTYVSAKPDSGNCYWARKSSSEQLEGIIANNNSAGQSVVTIKRSDKFFESNGCSQWVKR